MQYSTLFQTNEREREREEKKETAGETYVTKLLFPNTKVLGFSIMIFNKSKF